MTVLIVISVVAALSSLITTLWAGRTRDSAERLRREAGVLRIEVARYETSQLRNQSDLDSMRRNMEYEQALNESLRKSNDFLASKLTELASLPPKVIDVAPIVHAIGETLSLTLNGPAFGPAERDTQAKQTSQDKVNPLDESQMWLPDVEMDEWLQTQTGFPTRGGWVNRETNASLPPLNGQTPVHGITETGKIERLDGQPMFRQGEGANPPVSGRDE